MRVGPTLLVPLLVLLAAVIIEDPGRIDRVSITGGPEIDSAVVESLISLAILGLVVARAAHAALDEADRRSCLSGLLTQGREDRPPA